MCDKIGILNSLFNMCIVLFSVLQICMITLHKDHMQANCHPDHDPHGPPHAPPHVRIKKIIFVTHIYIYCGFIIFCGVPILVEFVGSDKHEF